MSLILLNDPHRVGGSSALNMNDDVGVLAGFNAAKLALWAADANTMFSELYDRLQYQIGVPIAFATVVPLTAIAYMPAQSVTALLAFTAAASPVSGAQVTVRLTADGNAGHIPTFAGAAIAGYVNTAGVVNYVSFTYSGSTAYVICGQDGSSVGSPMVLRPGIASLGIVHGVNPTLVVTTNGAAALNTTAVPPASAFTLSTTQGATINAVTLGNNSISLSLTGTVSLGDTATLSYTPPPFNTVQYPHATRIRDVNGNFLASLTLASVTVS